MLIGVHTIIYSTQPEADRLFLRDVLGLTFIDSGGGWFIFSLPPAELAVHPADQNNLQELYFQCDDIAAFIDRMHSRNISCEPVQELDWGRLTHLTLPGGGKLGVYQPSHARPAP